MNKAKGRETYIYVILSEQKEKEPTLNATYEWANRMNE